MHEDRLNAGASAAAAREAAAAAGQPAPRRRQRGAAAWAAAVEDVVVLDEPAEPESSGDMYTDSRSGLGVGRAMWASNGGWETRQKQQGRCARRWLKWALKLARMLR